MPVEANNAAGGNAPPRGASAAPAAAGSQPRSGFVGGPGQRTTPVEALHAAILADAAAAWPAPRAGSLQVMQTEVVTWPNGALGCPAPDMMYTQALVPGWRFVVSDGERKLVYHASRRGAWVWCPPGRATPPLPGGSAT